MPSEASRSAAAAAGTPCSGVRLRLAQCARKQVLDVQAWGVGVEIRAVETRPLHANDAENVAPLAIRELASARYKRSF